MNSIPRVLAFAVAAGLSVSQQSFWPKLYTEGTVWLSFVKLEPGMFGVYMQDAMVGRARVFVDEDLARTELVVLDLDFGLQVR